MPDSTTERAVRLQDSDAGVRTIVLHRPEALNAFNRALFDDLRGALEDALADDAVRCVALTGAGRAFSAGSDIGDGDGDPGQDDPYEPFIACLETFAKPLIAAVNGLAVGIGTTLLGHCDLVLAGASARFRVPFTSLGLVPEAGSSATLPALLGPQAAAHLFFTSEWLPAAAAAEAGLVWCVVADEELASATAEVCTQIAAQPLQALVSTKRLLLDARLPAARAARAREEPEFRRLAELPAHQEALAAFRERRPPDFRAVAS